MKWKTMLKKKTQKDIKEENEVLETEVSDE